MLEVLICAYGDHPRITIDSIKNIILFADKPKDLRIIVGTNACGKETTDWLRAMVDLKEIAVLVESVSNRNKDPTMRVLIEHVENPFFVWFDDDTFPVKKGWDTQVQKLIEKNDFEVSGLIHITSRDAYAGYKDFLGQRPWFRGWDVFEKNENPKLRDSSVFAHGAFWIARTEFLRKHDFPDQDMVKKADDMLLGELCAQQGGRLRHCGLGEWIGLNKGPRRGAGETAQDGWKGVVVPTVKAFDGLTIYPTGGMCNRLRNIITAIVLCREEKVPLRVVWENDSTQVGKVEFTDYWTLPADVTYESKPWSGMADMHGREKANRYLRVPRAKLHGAYHNHWGFCCLEGEEITERRLIQGLKENVVALRPEWVPTQHFQGLTGVHVRAFEFLFGERKDNQIKTLIEKVVEAMQAEPTDQNFFLATDSQEVQQAIQKAFPGRVLVQGHLGEGYLSRGSKKDFTAGVLDLYILGMCKRVLGTPGSSFSHLAGLMAGELKWMAGTSRAQKVWEG
jgi:hypothetical protein